MRRKSLSKSMKDKNSQLYGFYETSNKAQNKGNSGELQQPSDCCSSFWNWKPKTDYLALKLLREWSIHGTKYVVQRERHMIDRVFWLITVLCSVGVAAYLCYAAVKKYQSSPVIVAFQSSQISVSQVPFAAVTICSNNHFKKSALMKAFKVVANKDSEYNETEVKKNFILLRELEHICSATKSFSTKFNFSLDETTVNLKNRFGDNNYGTDKTMYEESAKEHMKYLSESTINCNDFIMECLWQGQSFECSRYFVQVVTDFGLCCSFNLMPSSIMWGESDKNNTVNSIQNQLLSKKELKGWSKLHFDKNLIKKLNTKDKYPFPRRQEKAGQSAGLSVLLRPQIGEYYCTSHNGYGYRMFAHSPIEMPHVLDFGLAVGTNTEMFVNLAAEVTIAEKDIKDIDYRDRHCYFSEDMKLANFAHYTSTNCCDELITNITIDRCNCILYDMHSNTAKVSFCENENFTCAEEIKKEIGIMGTKHFCGKCFASCNRIIYNTQTSSFPIRKDVDIWKSSHTENWSGQNVSILHVYFGSDSVYTRVRKRMITFNELFGSVGGLLGLFTGFSVISLVEPIYYLYRVLTAPKQELDASDDEDEDEEID